MRRPLAVLRADASRAIGTGHVVRSQALAEFLDDAGWRIVFAQGAGGDAANPSALDHYERILLTATDADSEAAELSQRIGSCDLLVVDHYDRDRRFEAACRSWARQILVLDDLADRQHACSVLLDPARDAAKSDYRDLVPADCALLLGPEFAPLRRQFLAARHRVAQQRRTTAVPRRVVISIGGIDADNLTSRALAAVLQAVPAVEADVVLGRAAPHLEAVRALARSHPRRVRVLSDVADMAALLAAADIGIGAAGSSSWERCCLGLPSIALPVVANQIPTAKILAERGAALVLPQGAGTTTPEIAGALSRLLRDTLLRRSLSERAMALCDGRGAWRVLLRLLADERGHDGEAVRLRLAERTDSDLMFAWQSLPEVRRYARHPEMPSRAGHDAWVESALASPERVLTLILHGGAPVGVLRFDRLDAAPSYEISILVDPRLHGRGVAAAALRLGQTLLRGATLHAEVDPENAASLQLFRGAGFHPADGRRLIWSNGREPAPRATEAHAAAEVIP